MNQILQLTDKLADIGEGLEFFDKKEYLNELDVEWIRNTNGVKTENHYNFIGLLKKQRKLQCILDKLYEEENECYLIDKLVKRNFIRESNGLQNYFNDEIEGINDSRMFLHIDFREMSNRMLYIYIIFYLIVIDIKELKFCFVILGRKRNVLELVDINYFDVIKLDQHLTDYFSNGLLIVFYNLTELQTEKVEYINYVNKNGAGICRLYYDFGRPSWERPDVTKLEFDSPAEKWKFMEQEKINDQKRIYMDNYNIYNPMQVIVEYIDSNYAGFCGLYDNNNFNEEYNEDFDKKYHFIHYRKIGVAAIIDFLREKYMELNLESNVKINANIEEYDDESDEKKQSI